MQEKRLDTIANKSKVTFSDNEKKLITVHAGKSNTCHRKKRNTMLTFGYIN